MVADNFSQSSGDEYEPWACFCGYHNNGIDQICLKCGTHRNAQPEPAPQPVPAAAPPQYATPGASLQSGMPLNLKFEGSGGGLLWICIKIGFFTVITLGIYSFWGQMAINRWVIDRMTLDGRRLVFNGNGMEYLVFSIVQGLLMAVTLGIFAPWAIINYIHWFLDRTKYAS